MMKYDSYLIVKPEKIVFVGFTTDLYPTLHYTIRIVFENDIVEKIEFSEKSEANRIFDLIKSKLKGDLL